MTELEKLVQTWEKHKPTGTPHEHIWNGFIDDAKAAIEREKQALNIADTAFIVEIEGETKVLSDKIESGDSVIGFVERPVNSYWIQDAVAKNVLDNGAMIVFKNGISCGRTDRGKWFKVIGTLNVC